jgi:hypothetical protein
MKKENLSERFSISLTPEEFSLIKENANLEQLSMSQYARSRLLWYDSYPKPCRFHKRKDCGSDRIYSPKYKGFIFTHDLSISRKTEKLYRKERQKVENIPDGWKKLLINSKLFNKT